VATILTKWVDSNLATTGDEKNLLIGFSKSGYGALDLLLKHPGVFDAAAAFDFPADMASYNDFGSSSSGDYGTDANFQDNYRMDQAFLDTWKAPFTTQDRILISEGSVFPTQVADFDTLLTSNGVQHTLLTQTSDAHTWYGGWLSADIAGLYGLETDLHQGGYIGLVLNGSSGGQTLTAGSGPTTLIGGPNDVLTGGSGADTFVFLPSFGANTVNNFTPGSDTLQFSHSTFASADAALSNAHQVGSNVAIAYDSLDVVTLQNMQLANLHASDFHIV
jgi:pimeloyl-ACP methyl ester carboxylesterase